MFRRRVIGSINISNKVDMTCGSKTYNGETQVATNITVTFKGNTLTEGVDYIVTENNGGVNVGSYVVKIKGIKKYSGEKQGTFSITKVTPTVTAPTPINNLVYNASAQALINAGSTNFGTLKYSLDNSTYSTSIPSGTNATSYTIYYKVDGDSNVNNVAAQSISNSIAKVTPTVTAPTPKVLTYNGSAQELINAGSTNYGTMQYKVGSDSWSTSIPTRTRGGAYTVYYKVVGDSNINDVASASTQCSINEKPVTAIVTVSPSAYTYSGSYCEPTVTVKDGETVIDPSEYTVVYSNNLNAGTATVTIYDVIGGDYYVTGSTTFEITQKAISIPTPTGVSRAYNGNAATATFGSATGASITKYRYSTNESSWTESTTNPSQTNAGTLYTQAYYKANDANYSGEGWSNSATIAISKADQSAPTATGATTTYHNTATATASGGGGQGTLTWTNGSTRTATGSQDTYAYWAGNSNYNASPNSNKVTLTVNKATDQSVTVTLTNRTYNTSGQVVASATAHGCTYYLGFGSSSTSAPTSWGSANSSISQTNAGTYYVWYKGTADGNHSADIGATYKGTVTIGKASQSAPTATGATTTYPTSATATASGGGGVGTLTWTNGSSRSTCGSQNTKAYWAGNSNYNASPESNQVTITVNKGACPSYTAPTAKSVVYNGSSQAIYNAGSSSNGSFSYSNGTRTNVGSQTVSWTFTPTDSCRNGASGSFTGSVTCKPCTAPTAKSLTYNGSNQVLVNAGSTSYGTMVYSTNGSSFSTTIPTGNAAGSYTVYWKVTGNTNVCCTASSSVAVTISCKSISIPTPTGVSRAYNGSAATATFPAATGASITKYRYSTNGSSWTETTSNPSQTNAGTLYTQAYYKYSNSNYCGEGWSSSATISISKASGSVTVTGNNLEYTGSAQALVSVSNQNTGTMHYRLGTNGSWSTSIPKATGVGSYTVYYYSDASTNYTAVGSSSSPKSVTSTIGVYMLKGPDSIRLANGVYEGRYGFVSSKSGAWSPVTVSDGGHVSATAVQTSGTNGLVTFTWSGNFGTDSIILTQTASGKTLKTYITK